MSSLPRTPSDIVSLIRAVNGSEFSLSGSEAELLVKLFASAAAESLKSKRYANDDSCRETQEAVASIFQNGV
jgi:hypothetical protein